MLCLLAQTYPTHLVLCEVCRKGCDINGAAHLMSEVFNEDAVHTMLVWECPR